MGRKLNAAKASIVAAFVAAGGATAAQANSTASSQINWGDQLIRFMKLDGMPAYFKGGGFAQLANYYKERLLIDAAALYQKYDKQVSDVLALYDKDKTELRGILIGLEQYYKEKNIEPLLNFVKDESAHAAYVKFQTFLSAMKEVSTEGGAFEFFYKETGILGDPLIRQEEIG
jgi:hypothetical protein